MKGFGEFIGSLLGAAAATAMGMGLLYLVGLAFGAGLSAGGI